MFITIIAVPFSERFFTLQERTSISNMRLIFKHFMGPRFCFPAEEEFDGPFLRCLLLESGVLLR